MQDVDEYRRFELADELRVVDPGTGFRTIVISNAKAEATVSTYGAQVLSYRPRGERHDLLFVSSQARYRTGAAIRGGIPVCWPWFGDDPEQRGRPAHGFVRTRQWQVVATESIPAGATRVTLTVEDTEETRSLWPHSFQLALVVTVGDSLQLELVTHNRGSDSMTISQALHAYLQVGDIARLQVLGLEGRSYLDKLAGFAKKCQCGALRVEGETDRIYTGVDGAVRVDDSAFDRIVEIVSGGSQTVVVWNPWAQKSKSMVDLGDGEYRRMLCVEVANAGHEVVTVPAGGAYRMSARYAVRSRAAG